MVAKKTEAFLYWLPRILNILFIIFLAMFSLDVFDGNYGFWGTALALFMHNIPVFILIGVLIISWRRPLVSAVAYPLLGILYIISMSGSSRMIIGNPIPYITLVIGVLYWVSWRSLPR